MHPKLPNKETALGWPDWSQLKRRFCVMPRSGCGFDSKPRHVFFPLQSKRAFFFVWPSSSSALASSGRSFVPRMSKRKVPAASPLMEALDDLEMTEDEEEIADQPTLKGPTSAKKSGYYVDHVAVINESTGAKKKRGRRLAETPEASRMYGEAMELFADGKVDEAKTKLQGVIADQPNMAEAYKS